MSDLRELLNDSYVVAILTGVGGALVTLIATAIKNRMVGVRYSVSHGPIGRSAQDRVFGDVTVTWQGEAVPSLHMSTVTVANNSNTDLTDFRFRVYTGNTLLLTESTQIEGSPFNVAFSPEFLASLAVPAGGVPTQEQRDIYRHRREYLVPTFNRGQRLILRYLTSVPAEHREEPMVFLDAQHKGVVVKFRKDRGASTLWGVPMGQAALLGIFVCAMAVAVLINVLTNLVLTGVACFIIGLFPTVVGAALLRGWYKFRRALS